MEKKKLESLRHSVKLHLNWFVRAVAGDEALSSAELKELNSFKALPTKSLDFVKKSFFLGRLSAVLKKKEYKDLSLANLEKSMKLAKLSKLEKLAVIEAQQSAGTYLRSFASEIEDGIFSRVAATDGKLVTEATIQGIIKDEVAFALLQNKTWEALAESLASELNTKLSKKVERIARTEMHGAKQRGIVQAIANKVDIYQHSDGPDSKVSVVTEAGCCSDCSKLYSEADGTPKIFKLSELLKNGTNADKQHTRTNGLHAHWLPVVPPSHPHCFCTLRYVPPGYGWEGRRLVLVSKEELQKAFGDSAVSATVKPKGPPQGVKLPPPGNVPGVAAPGKGGAATIKPSTSGSASAGTGIEYEYWADQGSPPADGGWEGYQKRDGGSGFRRPKGSGGQPASPEEEQAHKQAQIAESISWGKQEHPVEEHIRNLEKANIVDIRQLGDGESGATDSFLVALEGGGRAVMKPPAWTTGKHAAKAELGDFVTEGARSVPYGTAHKREAATFKAYQALGLTDFVPPTSIRNHEGQAMSMQSWAEGYKPIISSFDNEESSLRKAFTAKFGKDVEPENAVKHLLELVPEAKQEALLAKLSAGAVAAIAFNHNDQHLDNVIINDDWDVKFIDNSMTFGSGMDGCKNQIHRDLHRTGRKLKVPDDLLHKFDSTSLGDLKRTLGGDLEDWAVGQTYLRMKYLSHLQKTEGHLDFEKFRPIIGPGEEPLGGIDASIPRKGFWFDSYQDTYSEFYRRQDSGLLQNQLFDSFAKQWINDALAGPDGENKSSAQELSKLGVFMGPGHSVDKNHRRDKKHVKHEATIKPGYPPKDIKQATSIVTKEPKSKDIPKTQVSNKAPHKPFDIPKTRDSDTPAYQGARSPNAFGDTKTAATKRKPKTDAELDRTVKKSLYISLDRYGRK